MASRSPLDARIQRRIERAFQALTGPVPAGSHSVLPSQLIADRGYELICLIEVMRQLRAAKRGLRFRLMGGHALPLRVKGGPIDRQRFAWIDVLDGGWKIAEIWNNIQVVGLSGTGQSPTLAMRTRHAHELDIIVLPCERGRIRQSGYPESSEIAIAVEAKHRPYNKGLLKELLGVRRELSLLAGDYLPARFGWPLPFVAEPPVALIGYCSSLLITKYQDPNHKFFIEMIHLPL